MCVEARKTMALQIERESRFSERVRMAHQRNLCARISIGVVDPNHTEYLFVLRNPGSRGAPFELAPEELRRHLDNNSYTAMTGPNGYLASREQLARREAWFISSFGQDAACFGTTNLSIFHSNNIREIGSDFYGEIVDSVPLFRAEINLPRLRGVVLSGVSMGLFGLTMWQRGAPIETIEAEGIQAVRTTLITETSVLCLFIPHLCTRNLGRATIEAAARSFAAEIRVR